MNEKIVAKDRFKNEYPHEVTLRELKHESKDSNTKWILSFGGHMEYGIVGLLRNFPYQVGLCIDLGGRLHGAPDSVVVSADDMNKLLLKACEELDIDPKDYEKQATDAPSTIPPPRNEALEDLARKVKGDIDAGHTSGVPETPGDVQTGPDPEDLQHASDWGDGNGEDVHSENGKKTSSH